MAHELRARPVGGALVGLAAAAAPVLLLAGLLRPAAAADRIVIAAPRAMDGQLLVRPRDGWWAGCTEPNVISVLVDDDALHVRVTPPLGFAPLRLARDGHEWRELDRALRALHATERFAERRDVQMAAGGWSQAPVPYADLVRAIDAANRAGFDLVAVMAPRQLESPSPGTPAECSSCCTGPDFW